MPTDNGQGCRALFLVGRDPEHPGFAGGDHQAWQWATHLASRGWAVDYVCQGHAGLVRRSDHDGVTVLRLGRGPGLAVRAWRYYRRTSSAIDLVYEDPIGGGRVPYLAPLYSAAPVIAVWHQVSGALLDALHPRPVAAAMSLAERLVARAYRTSRLWVPSEERAREVSEELKIPADRIFVVPPTPGVELAVVPSVGPRPDRQILCVGVMRRYKSFEHVVEAFPAVLRSIPDARLVIAGRRADAAYEAWLMARVHALGIDSAVSFRFDVSNAERQALMRGSTALVVPSLLEGFGIVTMEANAEGTPVVASSGVPEAAVGDMKNGLRYPYGEVVALAACLVRILEDDALFTTLARASLEHARGLTREAVAPQFDALVAAALGADEPDADPAWRLR